MAQWVIFSESHYLLRKQSENPLGTLHLRNPFMWTHSISVVTLSGTNEKQVCSSRHDLNFSERSNNSLGVIQPQTMSIKICFPQSDFASIFNWELVLNRWSKYNLIMHKLNFYSWYLMKYHDHFSQSGSQKITLKELFISVVTWYVYILYACIYIYMNLYYTYVFAYV